MSQIEKSLIKFWKHTKAFGNRDYYKLFEKR